MNFVLIPLEDEIWKKGTDCRADAPDRSKMLCKLGESFRLPTGKRLPAFMIKQRFGTVVETATHPALVWNQDTESMNIQQVGRDEGVCACAYPSAEHTPLSPRRRELA